MQNHPRVDGVRRSHFTFFFKYRGRNEHVPLQKSFRVGSEPFCFRSFTGDETNTSPASTAFHDMCRHRAAGGFSTRLITRCWRQKNSIACQPYILSLCTRVVCIRKPHKRDSARRDEAGYVGLQEEGHGRGSGGRQKNGSTVFGFCPRLSLKRLSTTVIDTIQ